MDKFWMVIGDRGGTASKRHPSKGGAVQEAERLCNANRAPFIVLEAVDRVEPAAPPLVWSHLVEAPQEEHMGDIEGACFTEGEHDPASTGFGAGHSDGTQK